MSSCITVHERNKCRSRDSMRSFLDLSKENFDKAGEILASLAQTVDVHPIPDALSATVTILICGCRNQSVIYERSCGCRRAAVHCQRVRLRSRAIDCFRNQHLPASGTSHALAHASGALSHGRLVHRIPLGCHELARRCVRSDAQ